MTGIIALTLVETPGQVWDLPVPRGHDSFPDVVRFNNYHQDPWERF